MHPILFRTPFFTIYTFGVLLAAAYLSALWWVVRGARRQGLDAEEFMSLGTWAIVGALLGAKALLMVRAGADASLLSSAGDFYGGFIGALIASAIFFRRHPRLPVWRAADICAPAIALGQAIGRLGCFMAGDDYGSRTNVPWGIAFTNPDAADIGGVPLGVKLHPVQLYESAVCLVLFAVLVWLERRRHRDGDVIITHRALRNRTIRPRVLSRRRRSRLCVRGRALDVPIHRSEHVHHRRGCPRLSKRPPRRQPNG
jgi:phosphatidylglycerol:prolipoprotein diacylglycerol transferase